MSALRRLLRGIIPYPPADEMRDALRKKDATVVRRLLAEGFDPRAEDTDGTSFFLWAVERGMVGAVGAFLDAGADANAAEFTSGETPLLAAVAAGEAEVAELLIRRGAKVDARDRDGRTPLMHAADFADAVLVEQLLRAGADVRAKDYKGETPLSLAERQVNEDPEDEDARRALDLIRRALGK
jgi:FOG: Ankyrin repeat